MVTGESLIEASGKGTAGKVRVPALDLAPNGNGAGGTFAGTRLITGEFSGGLFEDYLADRRHRLGGLEARVEAAAQRDGDQPVEPGDRGVLPCGRA